MKRDFIIKTLNRLRDNLETYSKIKAMGIDTVDLLEKMGAASLPEEAIAIMVCDGTDKSFESALDMVQWWLYEDVEKKIIIQGAAIMVDTAERFTDWLIDFYKDAK